MEDESAFKYGKQKSVGSLFMQMMVSHVGLFIIIALYTALGAKLFIIFESGAEEQRRDEKESSALVVDDTLSFNAQLLWFYGDEQKFNWTFEEYNRTVYKDLLRTERYILDAIANNNYDGTVDGWDYDWTFMNSLLFSMTILTTIGYGNIAPKTFEGQMFCIAYALVGCPLFLVFLANLGNSMADGFIYIYSRCCCRCCRSRRYLSELPENTSRRFRKHVIDDVVGEEEYMPTSKLFVPIVINIVLLHLYFLLGGLLFASWENWETMSAIYFTFITLATIGYGDYVPGSSLTDQPDSLATTLKLIVCVLYIILGMALLSMCVNLMQEQIVEKCRWVSQKVGLSKNNNEVSEPTPMDKRKDSLMPLMEDSKGSSPFRKSDENIGLENSDGGRSPLPGILGGD